MAADAKRESSICFDLFEIDSADHQLRRSGLPVDLPPQALRILLLLASHANRLVSRKEIKEELWPGEEHGDFDSRMNFVVKKLREGLGDSAEVPRYIQTVRNAGYMFIAPVRVSAAGLAEAGAPAKGLAGEKGLRWSGGLLLTVGAVIMISLAFGVIALKQHRGTSAFPAEGAVQTHLSNLGGMDGLPSINFVSGIFPQGRQTIIVRGRGFGLHVPYSHTDSPFLAIRNNTADWAAGRIIPQNWDEVMVDVERWENNEIVISGFSGDYGKKGWVLHPGDQLEVAVWNPETGTGPAVYHVAVASMEAKR